MIKSGQILNFLELNDCENLLKILRTIPNQHVRGSNQQIHTNGFTKSDPIFSVIKIWFSRRNNFNLIPWDKLSIGMLLQANEPFGIHTDFHHKKDAGYGTAYLIPLNVIGAAPEKTYTVIFNQGWTQSNNIKDYINTNPAKPSTDIRGIWRDLPTDSLPEFYQEYLSVSHLAPWHLGSLIYWDRTLFHSSDNFRKKNISCKEALVLFISDE